MTGRPGIDGYLSEVAAVLPGPALRPPTSSPKPRRPSAWTRPTPTVRPVIPLDEAAAAATAEFGDPRQIAAGFGPERAWSRAASRAT